MVEGYSVPSPPVFVENFGSIFGLNEIHLESASWNICRRHIARSCGNGGYASRHRRCTQWLVRSWAASSPVARLRTIACADKIMLTVIDTYFSPKSHRARAA
jgi:hypothetical protein